MIDKSLFDTKDWSTPIESITEAIQYLQGKGYNSLWDKKAREMAVEVLKFQADALGITKKSNFSNERVVCAAIKVSEVNEHYNGLYLGLRHSDCFNLLKRIWVVRKDDLTTRSMYLFNSEQGFITTYKRFIDRYEAMEIATNQNQLIEGSLKLEELFSENLY